MGSPVEAGLVGPFQDDPVNEKEDKADADEKYGITIELPVVVGDHVIYLVDAEHDDEESVEDAEIG